MTNDKIKETFKEWQASRADIIALLESDKMAKLVEKALLPCIYLDGDRSYATKVAIAEILKEIRG